MRLFDKNKNGLYSNTSFNDEKNLNFTKFNDYIACLSGIEFDELYYYYPYMITPQELSFACLIGKVHEKNDNNNIYIDKLLDYMKEHYYRLNFNPITQNVSD